MFYAYLCGVLTTTMTQEKALIIENRRIIDLTFGELRSLLKDVIDEQLTKSSETKTSQHLKATDLLTRKQAAKRLNISLPTLREWTTTGKIKSCTVEGSRRVYYRIEAIEEALKPQTIAVRR